MTRLILGCIIFISLPGLSQKRLVDLENAQIWVNTLGLENRKEGQPVVVFQSGFGTPMGNWDRVVEEVAKLAPVVTYDRPGIGESPAVEYDPTIKNVADQLVRLLDQLKLPPPYVLVGHSLGGVYVRGFAVYYPELLAGLVIVDPGDFTETQINKRIYYEVLNWNDARINQEISKIDSMHAQRRIKMPPALQRESKMLSSLRQHNFQVIRKSPLPNIPVHILVGGRFDMPKEMRSKEYDSEALFRSKMKHRITRWTDEVNTVDKAMLLYSGDAGHFVHWDDPELLISSVKMVLQDYELMKDKD